MLLGLQSITPWDVQGGTDGTINYDRICSQVRAHFPYTYLLGGETDPTYMIIGTRILTGPLLQCLLVYAVWLLQNLGG